MHYISLYVYTIVNTGARVLNYLDGLESGKISLFLYTEKRHFYGRLI